jgi:hypothetical protein
LTNGASWWWSSNDRLIIGEDGMAKYVILAIALFLWFADVSGGGSEEPVTFFAEYGSMDFTVGPDCVLEVP